MKPTAGMRLWWVTDQAGNAYRPIRVIVTDAKRPPWFDRCVPRDRGMVKVRFPRSDCPYEHEKKNGRCLKRCGQMWVHLDELFREKPKKRRVRPVVKKRVRPKRVRERVRPRS